MRTVGRVIYKFVDEPIYWDRNYLPFTQLSRFDNNTMIGGWRVKQIK
jgi:hypothetical protein